MDPLSWTWRITPQKKSRTRSCYLLLWIGWTVRHCGWWIAASGSYHRDLQVVMEMIHVAATLIRADQGGFLIGCELCHIIDINSTKSSRWSSARICRIFPIEYSPYQDLFRSFLSLFGLAAKSMEPFGEFEQWANHIIPISTGYPIWTWLGFSLKKTTTAPIIK